MTSYIVTPLARADIDGIWAYIAARNPTAADRLLDRLRDTFALLARHPKMGQARDEVRLGLRSFSVGNYVIYLQFADEGPTIVRVVHGARDVGKLFERPDG